MTFFMFFLNVQKKMFTCFFLCRKVYLCLFTFDFHTILNEITEGEFFSEQTLKLAFTLGKLILFSITGP